MNLFFQEINQFSAGELKEGLWPSIWMSVATFLSLIIMFIVLTRFLYFPIKDILEKRQEKVRKELDGAAKLNENSLLTSEKINAEYKNIKVEREQTLNTAKEEAEILRQEILLKAKIEAEKTIKNGKEIVDLETKEAWNKLKNDISSLSIELAEKIILDKIDEKTEKKLIKEFLDNLENE